MNTETQIKSLALAGKSEREIIKAVKSNGRAITPHVEYVIGRESRRAEKIVTTIAGAILEHTPKRKLEKEVCKRFPGCDKSAFNRSYKEAFKLAATLND